MEVVRFDDAREFREQADPLLLANEAANNLIIGVTQTVIDHPKESDSFVGRVLLDEDQPCAAAAQTVPYNLILGIPRSEQSIERLASEIGDIPGVVGCQPGVDAFVAARPETYHLKMSQGVYQLDAITLPPPVDGVSRPARIDDADELAGMWIAFEEEAIGEVDAKETQGTVRAQIESQSPRHGAWVHEVGGQIVSLSGHKGPTPSGIRIGPVYTPPEHRGRGYASQLVAAHSQWLLDNGHRYCFLFTDLANPTSNSIYRRIGYRQIAESAQYELSPKT